MSNLNTPTIIYPNGGEYIVSNEINIQWMPAHPVNYDNRTVEYEIYYTDYFDDYQEQNWKQIATVGGNLNSFLWSFSPSIRSEKVRIGIRAKNTRGEKSSIAISADNFSINRKKINSPTVVSPINGDHFDKSMIIVTDDSGILGTHNERSFYQFYYSSVSANIPLTAIKQNVPVGEGPILWNIIDLPPADDYVIQVFLSDENGNSSESVFIRNIEIKHEGYFLLDTVPPETSIIINSNDTFTKDRNVSIKILSHDETSNTHSIQLFNSNIKYSPDTFSDFVNINLQGEDGLKKIEILSQDYGGNKNNNFIKKIFETFVELNDSKIIDVTIDNNSIVWAISSFPQKSLYKIDLFPKLIVSFEDEPTSLSYFGSYIVTATQTDQNTGNLLFYNNYELSTIKEFLTNDSIINTMINHDGILYIGMENGYLYSFNGLVFKEIGNINFPIKNIASSGKILYITVKNSVDIYVYNNVSITKIGG